MDCLFIMKVLSHWWFGEAQGWPQDARQLAVHTASIPRLPVDQLLGTHLHAGCLWAVPNRRKPSPKRQLPFGGTLQKVWARTTLSHQDGGQSCTSLHPPIHAACGWLGLYAMRRWPGTSVPRVARTWPLWVHSFCQVFDHALRF